MVRLIHALPGAPLLLAPLAAAAQPVPDALVVDWQGKKPCEGLYEDAQIRVLRCAFPPGAVHPRHSHPGVVSYTLNGGTGEVEDARGKRRVELRSGNHSINAPVPWHELTNTGDTTIIQLIVEKKYEPATAPGQASSR